MSGSCWIWPDVFCSLLMVSTRIMAPKVDKDARLDRQSAGKPGSGKREPPKGGAGGAFAWGSVKEGT